MTKGLPFYLAASVCSTAAAALFAGSGWAATESTQLALIGLGATMLLAAAWLLVWPARLRLLAEPMVDLPLALQDVRSELTDIVAIRQEYGKVRADLHDCALRIDESLDAMKGTLSVALDTLDRRQQAFDQAATDLRKADRENMDLRQARGDAQRQTEAWQKATIAFVRLLERTVDPESGLDRAYRQAATKLSKDFSRSFAPLGLQIIRPEADELLDDRLHDYDGETLTNDVAAGRIAECVEWGYILGDVVPSKAKVRLARPVLATESRPSESPLACESPDALHQERRSIEPTTTT